MRGAVRWEDWGCSRWLAGEEDVPEVRFGMSLERGAGIGGSAEDFLQWKAVPVHFPVTMCLCSLVSLPVGSIVFQEIFLETASCLQHLHDAEPKGWAIIWHATWRGSYTGMNLAPNISDPCNTFGTRSKNDWEIPPFPSCPSLHIKLPTRVLLFALQIPFNLIISCVKKPGEWISY